MNVLATDCMLSGMVNPFSPYTCAKCVVPDETARNEPSHQDLYCLHFVFDFRLEPLLTSMDMSKFKDGRAHFRNSGMKGLN